MNAQSPNANEKPGIMNQMMFGAGLALVVYLTLLFIEIVFKYMNRLSMSRTVLLPFTYNIDDKIKTIIQNPNITGSIPVHLSDNERSGVEFSYCFYLNVHQGAFKTAKGLNHIFHKGYPTQFPLLAPGVYMRSDTNTLRVYMNTYKTWNNFLEIENIPISKWVHVAIVCKDSALEIYINGDLKKKLSFDGFAPYQNNQDIICFSKRPITLRKIPLPDLDEDTTIFGPMKGMLSRLSYFSYGLCYAEIQKLMNEGPSSQMDSSSMNDVPPYLADTWWADGY